jgi:hypothetical protein
MVFAVATLLMKFFDLDFEKARRIVSFVIIAIVSLTVIMVCLFTYRACNKPPKLDLKNIEKINKANEVERRAELRKTIEENAGVVRTVDGRNTISEQDKTAKQAAIWAKIREVDDKIADAKSNGRDVTSEELECLLIPENCK